MGREPIDPSSQQHCQTGVWIAAKEPRCFGVVEVDDLPDEQSIRSTAVEHQSRAQDETAVDERVSQAGKSNDDRQHDDREEKKRLDGDNESTLAGEPSTR